MVPPSLTHLLRNSRQTGQPLAGAAPVPEDAAAADAVQLAVVGPIGGYKVFQVGTGEGKWGAIPAARIMAAPTEVAPVASEQKVEAEIAFRFGRALSPRADGADYTAAEVEAAVASAFAAFELLEVRLPAGSDPLVTRADAMGNAGLIMGAEVQDWRALVRADVAVQLSIGDRVVVDQAGGHPSGDPAHPLTWLVNALARTSHWIKAGDVVTTGAFGGSHVIHPGETAEARIEGFEPIRYRLTSFPKG